MSIPRAWANGSLSRGQYVTAEYDLLGPMRGSFLGHPPTGKAFRIKAVSIYEHNGADRDRR